MLETIAVILIILWLLGLVSSYTMGGFIHLLLVLAVVVILVRVFRVEGPWGDLRMLSPSRDRVSLQEETR